MTSRAYELSQTLDIDGDQHITGNTIVTGDLTFSGAGYMRVPVGTSADRPTTIAEAGQVRYIILISENMKDIMTQNGYLLVI